MEQMTLGQTLGAAQVNRPDITYEQFFSAADVAAYKRVKRGTMNLARVARHVVQVMVGGSLVQRDDSRKEYLVTKHGKYRLSMSHNSDNQTEMREHARLGAQVVAMGDHAQMLHFFRVHGLPPEASIRLMTQQVRELLAREA